MLGVPAGGEADRTSAAAGSECQANIVISVRANRQFLMRDRRAPYLHWLSSRSGGSVMPHFSACVDAASHMHTMP